MTQSPLVTCDSLLQHISSYLDGDLNETTCARVQAHAASCSHCARIIDDFRTTTGLCRKAAETPLPASVRERAQAQVRELLRTSATRTPRASRT